MAQHNEASVEEILESIKKVIARDNGDQEFLMRKPTERAEETLVESAPVQSATGEDAAEEVLDLADMEYLGDEGLVEPEADLELEEEDMAEEQPPLTTEAAAGAMRDNLAALAMLAEPPARPQIVRSGETSLEGLARELLRPMLAEWLDKNLPGMVEQMVQAEIARIAGKRK
ncbi:DUF2497 domain-containing protein [Altererythrobacter sp. GH1-8]|uniref:DUF2497 domain-containing protein n=1 Tax=Altererythrobacter sp. GH1-8 TaxID=3349333 RepID=UPI00374D9C3E